MLIVVHSKINLSFTVWSKTSKSNGKRNVYKKDKVNFQQF